MLYTLKKWVQDRETVCLTGMTRERVNAHMTRTAIACNAEWFPLGDTYTTTINNVIYQIAPEE